MKAVEPHRPLLVDNNRPRRSAGPVAPHQNGSPAVAPIVPYGNLQSELLRHSPPSLRGVYLVSLKDSLHRNERNIIHTFVSINQINERGKPGAPAARAP